MANFGFETNILPRSGEDCRRPGTLVSAEGVFWEAFVDLAIEKIGV